MTDRLQVPGPSPDEERRQWAEAVADLHHVVSIVVENAPELVPGEALDELRLAWSKSKVSMEALVRNLTPGDSTPANITYETLQRRELAGEVGKIKRSTLSRLKDRFLMFWNSQPRTDEKRLNASRAASELLEFADTVVGSIPGYEHVVEVLSLVRQLVRIRENRGV